MRKIMFSFFRQLATYRKGIKNGFIKETKQKDQVVWFVAPNAPQDVKDLNLPKLEKTLFYLLAAIRTTCVLVFLGLVLGISLENI